MPLVARPTENHVEIGRPPSTRAQLADGQLPWQTAKGKQLKTTRPALPRDGRLGLFCIHLLYIATRTGDPCRSTRVGFTGFTGVRTQRRLQRAEGGK